MKKYILLILFLFSLVNLYNCASQGLPGGGPKDSTPPAILLDNIIDGGTNIDTDTDIIFTLSEMPSKISVKKAITIFPLNLTDYSIQIKRKNIIITPESEWKENQFYTIIIDRDLCDLRGNNINKIITLSFSTGNKIPSGSIKGQIYGLNKNDNSMIIFSSLTNSLDSLFNKYEYYLQSDNNGSFHFNYLPSKKFIAFGFVDNDNNKKYEPKFDDLILPNKLFVNINDTITSNLDFTVVRDNFLTPKLIKIENIYQNETKLTFSKPISQMNDKNSFKINGTSIDTFIVKEKTVNIIHNYLDTDSATISINNLFDDFNQFLSDTSGEFFVNKFSDSSYTLQYTNKQLITTPLLDTTSLKGKLIVGDDTTFQTVHKKHSGFYEFNNQLKNKSIGGKFLLSLPNNKNYSFLNSDSTYSVNINQIVNTDSGRVIGQISYLPELVLILSNEKYNFQTRPNKNDDLLFDNLPSGKFQLYYYLDKNGNDHIDNGNIYPFISPEIQKSLMNDIQVRAHWDTDIGELKIKDAK
ncbi:MAG: Ig-like domain-containing protein [Candidatus Marinimicrobia bacterium]|nr:Ig-like domain-containing protein [Candidatus Neomarinimicrobiota bacterium]